jgi:3-oxoacyl-[acyl-carrier protein] reductase
MRALNTAGIEGVERGRVEVFSSRGNRRNFVHADDRRDYYPLLGAQILDLNISGKTGLVTGASSGIGRGIARALGREGVRLAITARRRDRLDALADEIVASGGSRPIVIECDFMREDAPETIARAALDALDAVEILVNNAGGSRRFTLDTTEAQWEEAITLNFTRQRQLTHRLLAPMIARRWGRIINITGKSEPEGINGAFCAKAAMHSWAKGLSREVGKHGITVNSIPPGRIMSEQIERNYTPEYRQWQSEHEIPVGEYGQPDDIAALVCFLASPVARYITGTVIPVDGGLRRYQF